MYLYEWKSGNKKGTVKGSTMYFAVKQVAGKLDLRIPARGDSVQMSIKKVGRIRKTWRVRWQEFTSQRDAMDCARAMLPADRSYAEVRNAVKTVEHLTML